MLKELKTIVFLVSLLLKLTAGAQQGIVLKPLETDSTKVILQREGEYRQLISGQLPHEFYLQNPEFTKFDFQSNFKSDYAFSLTRYFSLGNPETGFSLGPSASFISPYFGNATIISQGAYQLGNRFTFGGFNYGVNSPLRAPLPGPFGKFDNYGSTIFMQYKVSKNFKIETRINVQQGGHPGF